MTHSPIAHTIGWRRRHERRRRAQNDEERAYYTSTRRAFRRLAPYYDVVTTPISHLRREVVALVDPSRHTRVLDIATGTGDQAFAFAARGCDVTGVDLSGAMIRVAVNKNRYVNCTFRVADATRLPFADGSFDLTTISFGLHEMPEAVRQRVLAEMVRVTRRDGEIVIVDYALPETKIGRWAIYHLVSLYEHDYYKDFVAGDVARDLERAGLSIRERVPALFGAATIIRARLRQES